MSERYYVEYDNEINLKEIIMILWKSKVIIIVITIISALVSFFTTKFLMSEVYNTKLNIVINIPETCRTKYGDYPLPISTNEQYIKLIVSNGIITKTIKDMKYETGKVSVDNIIKRIIIEKNDNSPNTFNIVISADNPVESLELAKTLYKNYIEFIDIMINERAVNYFISNISIEVEKQKALLNINEERLLYNQTLLSQVPQTINQTKAMDEIRNSDINSLNYMVLENILNSNYSKLELDGLNIKQNIKEIKTLFDVNKTYISELLEVKKSIELYYTENTPPETKLTAIAANNIYMPSAPVKPHHKSKPNTLINVGVGLMAGCIFSVMGVLIKDYIKHSESSDPPTTNVEFKF